LSEFRDRILAGSAEALLLDALLAHCQARQLVKAGGRQRTDSTHVLAAIRVLNRLECVGEAMRQALNTLAVVAPTWLAGQVPSDWVERYGPRMEAYRLPKGQAAREALALTIGADGFLLWEALWAPDAPPWLRQIEAIEVLRQIWLQQFSQEDGRVVWRAEPDLPPAAQRINSPYDAQARYGTKRSTTWVGYKVHLSETCDDDLPHLITHVETASATGTDYGVLPTIQEDLAQRALGPGEHLVDAATWTRRI
jgi:transposase